MNLVIKRVEIKNFMRIREADEEMPLEGVIGILAQSVTDPDRSNYLGKTALLEAIRYALTGLSRASSETKLIHYGQEMMYVVVTLLDTDSGEEFVIKRGRTAKGEGLIEYSDSKKIGEKSAEAEKAIEDLLGLTPKEFDLTIFFKQAEINQFMNLDPASKKKMLMEWQNNDHWAKREAEVLKDIKEKKDEAKKIKVQLDNLNTDVGSLEEIQNQYSEADINVSNLTNSISVLESELEELSRVPNISQVEYQKLMSEQANLKKKAAQVKASYEEVEKAQTELDELNKSAPAPLTDKELEILEGGNYKVQQLRKELEDKKMTLEKLVKTNTGLCPIISETCDRIKLTPEKKSQAEKEIKDLRATLEDLSDKLAQIREKNNQIKAYFDKKQTLESTVANKAVLAERMSNIKSTHAKNKEILDKFDPEVSEKITKLKEKLSYERNLLSKAQARMGALSEKIRVVEENQEKANEYREQLHKLNEELDNLTYVAYMFGKNGIPSLEIENSFQNIENEMNASLALIDDIELIFRPDRELKAWEENCLSCGFKFPKNYRKTTCAECDEPRRKKRKDELALSVLDKGNETDFDMCSGGMKTIISLMVRTALTMMRKRQNKSNLNVIFLDEIDSPLDRVNKDKLMSFITNVLHKRYGFKQVFWISHDKTISHNVPHTILVKGYEDYSKVEWL